MFGDLIGKGITKPKTKDDDDKIEKIKNKLITFLKHQKKEYRSIEDFFNNNTKEEVLRKIENIYDDKANVIKKTFDPAIEHIEELLKDVKEI